MHVAILLEVIRLLGEEIGFDDDSLVKHVDEEVADELKIDCGRFIGTILSPMAYWSLTL